MNMCDSDSRQANLTSVLVNGVSYKMCPIEKYWLGQKICSGFSVRYYRKTPKTFLANPIFKEQEGQRYPNVAWFLHFHQNGVTLIPVVY